MSARSVVRTSKALSWLLRHGATEEGLMLLPGGWLKVSDVLKIPRFQKITLEELKTTVAECPKQRFQLKEDENGDLLIKANQGHSIELENPEFQEITSEEKVDCVVHGTYVKSWESIKKNGLSRMKRTHIHFAPRISDDAKCISGIRDSCQILIYIDLPKALQAGLKFYRSDNNVILCPGNEAGFLPPEYFIKVINRTSGEKLM